MAKKKDKKKETSLYGASSDDRAKGVSRKEWTKAREQEKASGRLPSQIASRKRQEALQATKTPQTPKTPQSTQGASFFSQKPESFFQSINKSEANGQDFFRQKPAEYQSKISAMDAFKAKVAPQIPEQSSPVNNFKRKINQVATEQQAQPKEPSLMQRIGGGIKNFANKTKEDLKFGVSNPIKTLKEVPGAIPKVANTIADFSFRPITRIALSTELSLAEKMTGQDTIQTDVNPISRFIFGKDPVTTYSKAGKDIGEQFNIKNPLAQAGISAALIALDFAGFKGNKKKIVEQVAKTIETNTLKKEAPTLTKLLAGKSPETIKSEQASSKMKQIVTGKTPESPTITPKPVIAETPIKTPVKEITPPKTAKESLKGIVPETIPAKIDQPKIETLTSPITKERGFIKTARNSENTAPEVASKIKGEYSPINNPDTIAQARASIAEDFEGAVSRAKDETKATLKNQSESLVLMDDLQNAGRYDDAIEIAEKMAERATEGGQATQILAAYNRLTPEGVLRFAQKQVSRAKKADPELYGKLEIKAEQAEALRGMAKKLEGLTGEAKADATREMLDEIGRLVPTPWARKATTLWKAGLLTGIKGAVGGNIVGNTAMATIKKVADVPAAGLDNALALITGQRSKVFTLKGLFSGAKEGLKIGVKNFRKGVGADQLGQKLDYKKVYFSKSKLGKAAQKYTDSVFNFYSAADRPFFHSALKNNLYDFAKVEAKNSNLSGKASREFIENLVKNPTEDILTKAHDSALTQVFQQRSMLGAGLSGAKKGLKEGFGAPGEIISEGLFPFTGVPSNIASAVHKYSPTGGISAILKATKQGVTGNFDQQAQRALSEALGKSVTGTGLIYLGSKLTETGKMTLGFPTDPGERALWEKEGKTPYSIQFFGKWRSLNYTGPVMSLLAIGGQMQEAEGTGVEAISQGALGSGKAILSSSPLSGAQAGLDAVSDPQRYGDSYVRNQASSGIPTFVKDVASSLDPLKREVNTVEDALKSKIPFAKNTLLPKRDIFGKEVERSTTALGAIFDPLRSSTATTDNLTSELRRLQDADYGPTLSKLNAKQKINGVEVELTPQELDKLEQNSGTKIQSMLEQLIENPEYKKSDDETKQTIINNIFSGVRSAVRDNESVENILKEETDTLKGKNTFQEVKGLRAQGKESQADSLINALNKDEFTEYNKAVSSEKSKANKGLPTYEEKAQEQYKSDFGSLTLQEKYGKIVAITDKKLKAEYVNKFAEEINSEYKGKDVPSWVTNITDNNPKFKAKLTAIDKGEGMTNTEAEINKLGVTNGERAKKIWEEVQGMEPEARKKRLRELKAKKIVSTEVLNQIYALGFGK